jgi:hypothetical protein
MLKNGASLPEIEARTLEGEQVTVGGLAAGSWSVVLFYRGHW